VGEQLVDEAVVELQARLVHLAGPGRLDARPGDREPVALGAQPRHQRDVLVPAVVVVAGLGATAAVEDPARLGGEGVPDARAPAVLGDRTLDLVRRGAGPEHESCRQQPLSLSHAGILDHAGAVRIGS